MIKVGTSLWKGLAEYGTFLRLLTLLTQGTLVLLLRPLHKAMKTEYMEAFLSGK